MLSALREDLNTIKKRKGINAVSDHALLKAIAATHKDKLDYDAIAKRLGCSETIVKDRLKIHHKYPPSSSSYSSGIAIEDQVETQTSLNVCMETASDGRGQQPNPHISQNHGGASQAQISEPVQQTQSSRRSARKPHPKKFFDDDYQAPRAHLESAKGKASRTRKSLALPSSFENESAE